MPFRARNARYLRISAHTVLPLYVYLDDKHVEWMSDYILQHVLEDLRLVIRPKLQAESTLSGSGASANMKKGTVDVHRGDTYQFAYFFRKNESHAVLIKTRSFVPALSSSENKGTSALEPPQSASSALKRKRSGRKSKSSTTKPVLGANIKPKKKASAQFDQDEAIEDFDCEGNTSEIIAEESPRRSRRERNVIARGYHESDGDEDDVVMPDSDYDPSETASVDDGPAEDIGNRVGIATPQAESQTPSVLDAESQRGFSSVFDIDTAGEEEKPKLAMKVSYQGFTIYDRCLCVVIEPWPQPREPSRARSVAPALSQTGTTESRQQTLMPHRERTPLFLPEIDPRRSLTPAPLPARILPPIPPYDANTDPPEDQGTALEDGGLMAFSQVLKSVGGERAGSADEDENEGEVFLGDADERKGDR